DGRAHDESHRGEDDDPKQVGAQAHARRRRPRRTRSRRTAITATATAQTTPTHPPIKPPAAAPTAAGPTAQQRIISKAAPANMEFVRDGWVCRLLTLRLPVH